MLTTRVIPTAGSAYVGSVDVIAQPALAKQLIGVVSQTNTLDRQLTVWENLYFHGRLFGMPAAESRRAADKLLEQWPERIVARVASAAESGGFDLVDLAVAEPTLETVFINLTGKELRE